MRKLFWRELPFLADASVKPVLYGLPVVIFLLFLLLIRGLSKAIG